LKPTIINHIIFVAILFLLLSNRVVAQKVNEIQINETFQNQPLKDFLTVLHENYGLKVFYKEIWVEPFTITKTFENTPLLQALNNVFYEHELTYNLFQDDGIVVFRKSMDVRSKFDDQAQSMIIGNPLNIGRYKSAEIKGRVLDGKTGETLAGAVVYNNKLQKGTTTNTKGEFELNLPTGDHQLQFSFVGFENSNPRIRLIENGFADFEIYEESHSIGEVTVLGLQNDLPRSQMSMVQMTTAEMKRMPALMGEVDILKGLTMLAGVQTVSEMSSGFNVRGGNSDQNLILVNGSPVFNSSHLFGFLSLINPDVVEDVRLFKGGMPVKLGERVSSVMEVDFKEGNTEVFRVFGGIGLINSRIAVEGPLTKNKKLTFVAGGRTSYTNWILKEVPDVIISQSVTNFYDASGKLTYKFNQHNKLSVMGYLSNDEFSTSVQTVNEYGSKLANLTLNSRFAESVYGELELSYSEYNYQLTDYANQSPEEAYYMSNMLKYSSAGYYFKWHPTPRHNAEAGFKANFNNISPGEINPLEEVSLIDYQKLDEEKLLEWAAYVGDEFEVMPNFSFSAGLRYSRASNIGTPLVYIYDPEKPISPETVIDSLKFGQNEVSASYGGFEPRLLFNFDLNGNTTLKLNYQRTRQNVFQLSNSAVISPAETWKAVDYYMKPIISDQIAFGVDNNSWFDNIDFSAELYFKYLQNLVEYKNSAQLIMNEYIETALIPTQGYSYGIELSGKKSIGRLTGYASYVFSATKQKNTSRFDDENFWDGNYYRSIYDRPHDFSFTGTYNISRRWRVSGNFVFISGRPVTLPEIKYQFAGEQLVYYSDRNKYRMPSYNRADISLTFDENLRKKRMWKGSWTLSVYNVYGRKNPYSVYYKKSVPAESNDYRLYSLYKLSVIGVPVPSITYNFKF
jgi:hypothetical protein